MVSRITLSSYWTLKPLVRAADMKKMELVAKYNRIRSEGDGKVKDYLTKRRKKNAAKDHRYVPYERR